MSTSKSTKISYSEFLQMVREDKVERVLLESNKYTIYPKGEKRPSASTPQETSQPEVTPIPGLENLEEVAGAVRSERGDGDTYYCAPIADDRLLDILDEHGVGYEAPYIEQLSPIIEFLLTWILPTVLMMVLLSFLFRNMSSKMGGGLGGVGKANAKVYVEKSTGVTFKDVAGQDEAKESMVEIIDILHNPQKYTEIGAKLPKGALLVGPPGTGKTLLAKAVAGEAGVGFLSISGSDFVELYVGVGASRVRDLFDQAKKNSPAIVFIDEIDAVGRQRGTGLGGGHDEREQTLNQLLVEMDGFAANEGVVVLAATNRADVLDPALLRPGRFDRQVYVGLPDIKGREEILKVHAKGKPLAEDVSLRKLAQGTAGFTGADLENLINEGALLAARKDQHFITMQDLKDAEIKVIAGPEKKSRVIPQHERELTAYHEAGHAVVMHMLPGQDPVSQITIVPRGMAG
ncbi:MAG: ATP-dependent zinc metalloprotease FtsH, partial [Intestinimonas butyriciproducens]|nr:ATP-dependent zinc metalloprotease FtsH [Intestinimonas butyriciproducens]